MDTFSSIPTPAAVVDLDRLDANLRRMQRYCDEHGLALRPHAKTHKAPWLAEAQVAGGARGITVATPVEAVRIGAAAPELLVAYPAFGRRAHLLAALARRRGPDRPLLVGLDSVAAVQALREALREALRSGTAGSPEGRGAHAHARAEADPTGGPGTRAPVEIGVLVELDLGMRRCGVPDGAAAVEVARACGDGVVFRGVMFYPGHIRQPVGEQEADLDRLGEALAARLDALRTAGYDPEIVSGGSTPTAFGSHRIPQTTEIRPGTYVYNDRTTAAIGACSWDHCAYTVLATVASTAVPGQAVVDAGSKALSSDPLRAPGYGGYGQLLDRPEVVVDRMSEEHGILDLSRTDWRPEPGERVRIIPNHVCVSVNLHPRVYGVRDGAVEREWEVEGRGWDPGSMIYDL